MKPRLVPIADLELDPHNARRHNERNLDVLAKSLERFDQRKPIVVNERTMRIEAGNGTLTRAIELGATHIVAVFVDDDEETAAAYAIADNRSAELATWDAEQLASTIGEFPEVDWGDLGWSADDFDGLDADWPLTETTTVSEHERTLESPEDFPEYDDETIETQYKCPKCNSASTC